MNVPAAATPTTDPLKELRHTPAAIRETHTGLVVLVGDRAYKVKKPVVTDFLDFSTSERREQVCAREVRLNRRLAPDSYLGVAHFDNAGQAAPEPVIVMRRYPDSLRLSTMAAAGEPVDEHIVRIAEALARFHVDAERSPAIDACARVPAITRRWDENVVDCGVTSARFCPRIVFPRWRGWRSNSSRAARSCWRNGSLTTALSMGTATFLPTTSSVCRTDRFCSTA